VSTARNPDSSQNRICAPSRGLADRCRKTLALPPGDGILIALHHETGTVYVGASSEISQRGGGFFLRGIRMYHDSTMLENAKAMPREAAIVLSI
jgi:hypothetical protein